MIGGANIIYEEGEDADEALATRNLPLALAALPAGGIKDQTTIEVSEWMRVFGVEAILRGIINPPPHPPTHSLYLGGRCLAGPDAAHPRLPPGL